MTPSNEDMGTAPSALDVLTKQQVVDAAPARWAEQYEGTSDLRHIQIGKDLAALTKPIKAADVDAITGNGSWTQLECEVCQTDADVVVSVCAGLREYSLNVCPDCLRSAIALAESRS